MLETTIRPQLFCSRTEDFILEPRKKKVEVISGINKPRWCLWTSTCYEEDEKKSAWTEWCKRWEYDDTGVAKFKLIPKREIKIYRIDNTEDYDRMKFACAYPPELAHLFKHMSIDFMFKRMSIDFNWYIENSYDGIHVTANGVAANYCRNNKIGDNIYDDLCHWDCESTVWFNYDWIDKIERIDSSGEELENKNRHKGKRKRGRS